MGYKDPEKQRAYLLEWRKKNRDKEIANGKRWRAENAERDRANKHKRYEKNKETVIEQNKRWRTNNLEKHRDYLRTSKARRRTLMSGATVSRVDRSFVWNRDKGICYLCGKAIDPKRVHYDHVIPISKGGAHTVENLRPTHPYCNRSKGAKLIDLK